MSERRDWSVYFIKSKDHLKIGISKDVNSRISAIQTGNQHKLKLVGVIDGLSKDVALRYEKALHGFFVNCHTSGEWFLAPKFDCYDEGSQTLVYGDGGFLIDAVVGETP